MDRVCCPTCGEEHDLHEIEPCFDRPDAYFAIPEAERRTRAWNGDQLCVLWEHNDLPRRHFVRAILPIPIRGEPNSYAWGVWIEVAESDFSFIHDHWTDPNQASAAPMPGHLANELPSMASTLGLPGTLQLTGPSTVPEYHLDRTLPHELAAEQRDGVFTERLVEWAARAVHG